MKTKRRGAKSTSGDKSMTRKRRLTDHLVGVAAIEVLCRAQLDHAVAAHAANVLLCVLSGKLKAVAYSGGDSTQRTHDARMA